jgi:predicted O-linked N-acetylglucosamine transferase (SPINDLY family)
MASWGHPETTGLPTIDYFISGEELEPGNADENYSEKLIKLANLGCFFEPSGVAPSKLAIEDLGLSRDQPILLCAGSPSKYSPENDEVLVKIAKGLGECQLVFFDFQSELTKILKGRLASCFQKEHLKLNEYVKFIPFQSKENFYALMKQSDLYLDTIGFSGFNTAMQAIECNLPVVTIEEKFMRGRLASGILNRMGMRSLIAQSNEEYIASTLDLILNREKLHLRQSQLKKNLLILFNDLEPIRTFEQFLLSQRN